MKKYIIPLALCSCALLAGEHVLAQKQEQKPPSVGASFLQINPDARTSGMGDAPTGVEPDANALFHNAAKIVFAGDWGVSASYAPRMWELNNNGSGNTALFYVAGFKNFDDKEGIGLSMKYFHHGDVTFRDDNGAVLQQYKPKEFAVDASYARKLGNRLALAISLRYIRSDLGNGTFNGLQQKPAQAGAGDIGLYYQNNVDHIDFGNRYSWGVSFTNIGNKLKYTDDANRKTFLPMNLRIGGGYSFVHTTEHTFTLAAEVNKLLVPTPPIYVEDNNGVPTSEIAKGKDPNRGVAAALFSSLWDAPDGFREEIREFTAAGGIEYAYQHQFFVRAGYFREHPNKGFRQHFAAGIGARVKMFQFDMAYVMPTDNSQFRRKSLKFSLLYTLSPEK
ncbi:type IX secretion system outer membrane channel protein PorV [Chitinophaga sedimenti]|uniref:type IX secretion system outer membrane channel protein PorV n=1 Tax=Chitinophaga sedimenti TaxID=2033606 RepID=UPI00200314D8|nr:type IX secretion system outer membrane channel protein PorV [Chitinophaga sedimenti]MCK7559870.1 type IX secretion system outer membrane channel protein PorV [Chitinophaga sedimenti]